MFVTIYVWFHLNSLNLGIVQNSIFTAAKLKLITTKSKTVEKLPVTIITKKSHPIIDVWECSEYVSRSWTTSKMNLIFLIFMQVWLEIFRSLQEVMLSGLYNSHFWMKHTQNFPQTHVEGIHSFKVRREIMKDTKNDTLGNMGTFQKPLLTFQNWCYWYDSHFSEYYLGAIIYFTGLNRVINMMLIRIGSKPTSSVTVT